MQRRKLLVVDDLPDAADSLAGLLNAYGYDADVARNGGEALSVCRAQRPHAILLDLKMPGIDGHEVCRQIRREPWGKDVLCIAITGMTRKEDKQRAEEAGFDAYLLKPVNPSELRDLLRRGPRRAPRDGGGHAGAAGC